MSSFLLICRVEYCFYTVSVAYSASCLNLGRLDILGSAAVVPSLSVLMCVDSVYSPNSCSVELFSMFVVNV